MRKINSIAVLLLGACFVADRILKSFVGMGGRAILGPIEITKFSNTGLIFSIPVPVWLSIALMISSGALLAWYVWRFRKDPNMRMGIALISVGAISNLYDRLVLGYIVDYIYISDRLPIVNIADLMILAGLVRLLFRRPLTRRPA